MKLEFKHLAAYLPYSLRGKMVMKSGKLSAGMDISLDMIRDSGIANTNGRTDIFIIKPILRPLSDLNRFIEHNGEMFVPLEELQDWQELYMDKNRELCEKEDGSHKVWVLETTLSYKSVSLLLEWHFDVFKLIENNLAIDINILKTEHKNN